MRKLGNFTAPSRFEVLLGLISDGVRCAARVQNGTGEDVKKIVTVLNEVEVPSEDVVGESSQLSSPWRTTSKNCFGRGLSDWIDLR